MKNRLKKLNFKEVEISEGKDILHVFSKKHLYSSIFVLIHEINGIKQPVECWVNGEVKPVHFILTSLELIIKLKT